MASGNGGLALRRFEEVWNQRRTDTIDELLNDESVSYSESGPLRGSREFKERAHAVFLSAFPDLKITVEGTVAEGMRSSSAGRYGRPTWATGWGSRRPGGRSRSGA